MTLPGRAIGWGLVILLVLGVGGVISGLLGSVLMVQGAFGIVLLLALLFIGSQVALFRLFGVRSEADERAAGRHTRAETDDDDDEPDDPDWRAWRG